ncbi:hypothetical protein [Geobacter argillaceus]|uniref:Oligosaccharide repeat unit polymerase n=1 Tax=Geobacter argillaceus TaxID=345631 RepID=A0A562W9J2_9BACT|nr:hypothetical protein [Geobacter argillaceus]TWJ26354.1 hypothetical protein JN12_01060 [Geobacter argillaceus]
MIVSKEKIAAIPILLTLWLSGFIFPTVIPLVMLAMTLISIRLIFLYKNVQPVFIYYIFHLSYVVMLIPYFLFDIPITPHSEFQIAKYMDSTLLVHGAFVFTLYFFSDLNAPKQLVVIAEHLPSRKDTAVFLFLAGAMLAIIVSMQIGSVNIYSIDAAQAWDAYNDNISASSGAPEYFLVFFVTAFIFAKSYRLKLILTIIFCIFIYSGFTRGMRVSLLMPILLYFALFLDGKFRTRYIFIMAIVGMVLVQAAGFLRDGKRAAMELFSLFSGTALLTNQGEVFYTTNIIVSALIDGVCGMKERMFSLFAALLQTILPPRIGLGSIGKPALYVWDLTGREAGGGGLISGFFYFWLDYFGVVLIAFFIAILTNKVINKPTSLLSLYIICLYSFYPRWLAYDPVNFMFRMPLYAICLYLLLKQFQMTMKLVKDSKKDMTLPSGVTP